jgi:adenine C2-methylase RlmN of 23S rRNA A2503 and tRNA A37
VQKVYPFDKVLDVIDEKIAKTKRMVWIAYLLLKGVNDSPEHAKELVRIIKSRPGHLNYLYHINLLPYNEAKAVGDGYKMSEEVKEFEKILRAEHISMSFRNSFGRSIDAACGQLAGQVKDRTRLHDKQSRKISIPIKELAAS